MPSVKKKSTPVKKKLASVKKSTSLKDKKKSTSLKDKKKSTSLKEFSNKLKDIPKIPIFRKQMYKKPYSDWLIKNYMDLYGDINTLPKIKTYLKNNSDNLLYGSIGRINTYAIFGYKMNLDIVDTICITFKIKDLKNDKETIFAYGYCDEKPTDTINSNIAVAYVLQNSRISFNYFTIGGSFLSVDGEYRLSIIQGVNLLKIKNTPVILNIFYDIENYIQEKNIERRMLLSREYFYPTDDKKILQQELEQITFSLQTLLYVINWFKIMLNEKLGITENHLNEKFKSIMFEHKKEDLVFFNELVSRYGDYYISAFRTLISHVFLNHNEPEASGTKIGQKIIPLNLAEVQHPFNIKYKPWREYLIANRLSDLVVNNVTPGFFITNSWFYIKNSRKGLFDNEIQYEKMEQSDTAIQITDLLINAQSHAFANTQRARNKSTKSRKKILNTWLSDKFQNLHDKIQDPISFAKEDIIMSNVALCVISEYVGRTLMDVMHISTGQYYNNLIGRPFTQQGYPMFAKYMFDLCYNLYSMNSLLGVIHGDLHLNNATFNTIAYQNQTDIKKSVLYILGDDEQYIFPTTGYNVCLIDFSRSIILPESIQLFKDTALPKSYNIITNIKDFQVEQVNRLLRMYLNYAVDSDCNKDELQILFKNHFEAVFKLLTVVDLFGVTQKLDLLFSSKATGIVQPHASCIKLLRKINKLAEYYMTSEMNKLILNISYEKEILQAEFPIKTIIKQCFYDFLTGTADIDNIIDIYNINNELKYSLNKYENYPPSVKDPKHIIDGKIISNPYKTTDKKVLNFTKIVNTRLTFEQNKDNGMKLINFIATRQKQKYL
jgi:hypothetical protein